jgi:DNA-binding NarL/FixJ family response regulator
MGRSPGGTVTGLRVRVQANRLAIGEAVAAAIEEVVGVPVIADTTDPTQTHRAARRPDVVVVVGSRRDGSTSAGVRMARRRWPQSLVIALSESDRVGEGVALVRQGADAWLSPNEGLDVLRSLLARIGAGERVLLTPDALAQIAATLNQSTSDAADAGSSLTSRERQILECFANGMTRAEIAEELLISRATVRTHVQNILRKLDLHSINHAVSFSLRDETGATRAAVDGSSGVSPRGVSTGHT